MQFIKYLHTHTFTQHTLLQLWYTHTHIHPHWAHTDHKWGCFCCCFCCSWLVLNWPKVEKALWVCMAKQSKHDSVTFLCRRFVLHVSVFLFCIYFMPAEKYNLFSCPESGAKMRSGLHYSAWSGLVSPLENPLLLPIHSICQFHFTLCILCCTPFVQLRLAPHTALHGLVMLWK